MKKYILLFFVFFITGCSKYDINNLAIVNEIGISYDKSYNVFLKTLNNSDETIIYSEGGKTIDECFFKLNNNIDKKIYLTHLELLILDENLEKEQFKEIFNFFLDQESSRNTFSTIITDRIDKKVLEESSSDILNKLKLSIDTVGIVRDITLDNIIKNIFDFGISYVPFYKDGEFKSYYEIYDIKKKLRKDDSIIINFLENNIKSITLLINNNSFKLSNCSTLFNINDNSLLYNIKCEYEGSFSKTIIENYINEAFNKYINDNDIKYFNYLAFKYNIKKLDNINLTVNILSSKTNTGDYFE